jgi:hypothetical protein
MATANGIASNGEVAVAGIDSDLICLVCHEDYDLEIHIPKVESHSSYIMNPMLLL